MGKKTFILIVFLMTISLIGIIVVQVYWIGNAIEIREKQFTNDVNYALAKTNERIYKKILSVFLFSLWISSKTKKLPKKPIFQNLFTNK